MTRFFVTVSVKNALSQIDSLCTKFGYATKRTTAVQLTVFTVDTRRNNLSFKVNVYETNNRRVLVDFRLSKVKKLINLIFFINSQIGFLKFLG